MEKKYHFYIHSEIFELSNFTDNNMKAYQKQLNVILEVGRHLKADVFYALNDVNSLREYFTAFDENFTKSQANILDVLLEDFKQNKKDGLFFNLNFINEQSTLIYKDYPFLQKSFDEDVLNIVFCLNQSGEEHLLWAKSNQEFEHQKIHFFSKPKEIWQFINQNLPKRVYHFSSKHGNENTIANPPKRSEKVSQLKCSDQRAQELLNDAIFDNREKTRFHYNFDEIFDTFIVFPFEGDNPQNQFHAFHIEENEWEKEIPQSIRKYFNL